MKYWIISDTHMQHANILKWCERKEGYEEVILKSIWDNVGVDDVLIHLGDVAWKNPMDWNMAVNEGCRGRTWLVKGNHDRNTHSWYLGRGWDFVADSFMLNRFGKRILFTHVPQAKAGYYDINIHGHLHTMGHHDEEYQKTKHDGQILIEIESHMGVKSLDSVLNKFIKGKR